jgi:hypothetical protein
MLAAELTGEARHHARWRPLTEEEEAAAVNELRELAAGRTDLLAQAGGHAAQVAEKELAGPLRELVSAVLSEGSHGAR